MNRENYVEPMVADSKGNLYVSMKYHKENIEDLQQRIDKAIEYIKKDSWHYTYEDDCDIYLCENELEELLEILKGDDSNE